MKLLVFAIDAADPKVLFEHIDEFPNFRRLCDQGASGRLEGYCLGYGSYDNWASVYTGLTPRQHGVLDSSGHSEACPGPADVAPHAPLWEVLNERGFTTSWVRGLMMNPPPPVDGWVMGGDPEFLHRETSTKYPVFHEKDLHLAEHLRGEVMSEPRPRLLEELGATWPDVSADPGLLARVLRDDYFAEFVDFARSEANYYTENAIRLQRHAPTDLLFVYLSSLDILQHFQMHERGWRSVREGYRVLDDCLGRLLDELEPENVLVLSDHGQEPFHMLFPDTPRDVQEEAFGWPVRAWRDDGTILCKGITGVLSAVHCMLGVSIFWGRDFEPGANVDRSHIIDVYPTILRLFGVDCERPGRIIPAFRDTRLHGAKPEPPEHAHIAVIQNLPVYETLRSVNELYLRFRDARITVIGAERFRRTFLYDPRVSDFIDIATLSFDRNAYGGAKLESLRRTHPDLDLVVLPFSESGSVRELWL